MTTAILDQAGPAAASDIHAPGNALIGFAPLGAVLFAATLGY